MRATYRNKGNKDYWKARWENISIDPPKLNPDVYPLKYCIETIKKKEAFILEAGCGAGRILNYYHSLGYKIKGIDFIESVIDRLKKFDSSLDVEQGDIAELQYQDATFDYILAFGLYHNLEYNVDDALRESFRVLKNQGTLCASFRADNIQNFLIDSEARKKSNSSVDSELFFHKMNYTVRDLKKLITGSGFRIISIEPVVNMPLLYKFRFFRDRGHKIFNEPLGRQEGYRLSKFGKYIQMLLMHVLPNVFCNVYVVKAIKER
ncbi:methyltransferase domain-containing protein [Litoricola sp.]|nr:methyltransferase domain-containing protein [Litorivicinus sp.]